MLLGVLPDDANAQVARGRSVRLYVPYGPNWARYWMRRLAESGVTTREACGNSVRNITGCPYAGVGADEIFDVAIDLHEAELQYPVISTIVTHQKGQDMATMVSMTLTELSFSFVT
mgnify:CR=1 FL=1